MKKPTTPFADLLPPLSTEEFAALRADIEAHGVHVPVDVDEDGNVLDGHHRLKIAPDAPRRIVKGLTEAEKSAYVFQANFARRNLSPSQKTEARQRMKGIAKALRAEDAKKNTQARVAALLGVDRSTVAKWFPPIISNVTIHNAYIPPPDARVKVPPKARPVVAARVEAGETQAQVAADYGVTQPQVSAIVKKERQHGEAKAERARVVAALGADDLGIHLGDFREGGAILADNSVDLIFTDPPYDEASLPLYGDLAAFAARVLRPGGWCLAYCGQIGLPRALAAMAESLTYGWTFAVLHAGGDLRFRKFKLQNGWKPILGFYKPPLAVWWDWFPDVATGGKEKAEHEWQQAQSEAEHFIQALSPDNALICDPMCGSGTTCAAAKATGRRWIAWEIDAEATQTAKARIT